MAYCQVIKFISRNLIIDADLPYIAENHVLKNVWKTLSLLSC